MNSNPSPNELDLRCERFTRDFQAGTGPRIEQYLHGLPEAERELLLSRLLRLQWSLQKSAGENLQVEDMVRRFPEQRGLIESLADGSRDIGSSGDWSVTRDVSDFQEHDKAAEDLASVTVLRTDRSTIYHDPSDAPTGEEHPRGHGASSPQNAILRAGENREPRVTRYVVKSEVGRGGMGIVYKAQDEKLGRSLAIKVLQAAGDLNSEQQQREIARFLEEAKLSAQLDHPGLVPVYELDHDPKFGCYFTMRLVKGMHFGEVSRLARAGQDGWNLPRAIGVIVKACDAVAYAHSKYVIHRDLKPSNVMVGQFGAVYVMDWGLAKVLGQEDHHDLRPQWDPDSATRTLIRSTRHGSGDSTAETPLITMDGSVIGTPAYMPPEQAKGMVEEVDDKSDIYSLGAILYHLLTGQPPYVEAGTRLSPHTILGMVIQGPPQRIKKLNPDAPAELVAICEKAMAREKSHRYGTSLDLAEDLQAYLDGRVVRAYRTGAIAELRSWVSRNRTTALAGMGVVLAVLAGLLGVVAVQRHSAGRIRAAREETRRYLYDGNIQLIQQAWESGAVFRARELLDRHIPRPDETDLRSFGWYYFDNLCRQSEEAPLLQNDDIVTAIAFSPSANRLAVGCNDGRVRLWISDTWTRELLPGEHQPKEGSPQFPAVDALIFSPDGKKVISAGRFGDVMVHDTEDASAPLLLDELAYPWSMDLSASGRFLAAPDVSRRDILIWELDNDSSPSRTPRRIRATEGESDRVEAVHFSIDGEHLFTHGTAGVAKRWRVHDGELVGSYGQPMETKIPLLDVSPDGRQLAINHGTEILVWEIESGERLGSANGPALGMKHLLFSNSGEHLAACSLSESGEVLIWKVDASGIELIPSETRHQGRIARMDVLGGSSERLVTTGGRENLVKVWSMVSGDLIATFRGHGNELYGLAASHDGRFVATGGRGGDVRLWDVDKTPPSTVLSGHEGTVWSAAISASGNLAVTASGDGNLRLWDARSGTLIGLFADRRQGADQNQPAHSGSAQFVCFFPDNQDEQLVSCGKDGNINLWSVSRRELIGQIRAAHERGTNALGFTMDQQKLVSCGDDGLVKIWNVSDLFALSDNAEPLRVLGPIGPAVWGLACSPTRSLIAAGGKVPENKVLVWDLDSDLPPVELVGHTNNVTSLNFSEDGRTLASTSQDSSVRRWDMTTFTELPEPQSPLRGHSGDVQFMAYTPDGLSVLTASMDHSVRIWDRKTGESKCALTGHSGGVQHLAISQDGNVLVTSSWDRTARIWRAPRP